MTGVNELIERLRRLSKDSVGNYGMPIAGEAADALEAQAREIERLKQRCADEKGAADAYAMSLAAAERERDDAREGGTELFKLVNKYLDERDEIKRLWFADADPKETRFADEYAAMEGK